MTCPACLRCQRHCNIVLLQRNCVQWLCSNTNCAVQLTPSSTYTTETHTHPSCSLAEPPHAHSTTHMLQVAHHTAHQYTGAAQSSCRSQSGRTIALQTPTGAVAIRNARTAQPGMNIPSQTRPARLGPSWARLALLSWHRQPCTAAGDATTANTADSHGLGRTRQTALWEESTIDAASVALVWQDLELCHQAHVVAAPVGIGQAVTRL